MFCSLGNILCPKPPMILSFKAYEIIEIQIMQSWKAQLYDCRISLILFLPINLLLLI
jgi:hypothetical protein